MKVEQRRTAILELLMTEEAAGIHDLAHRFGVSHMTIRRDLEGLSLEGRVSVGRGEARISQNSGIEPRYAAKQRVNATLKAQIARYAAHHFVRDGDVLLMEGGTTVTAMAQHLQGKSGLTVVTNGLYTMNELAHLVPHVTVMSTGGILRDFSFTYVGPAAEDFLANVHAGTAFVSATGFTLEHGFTDPNPLESRVRKAMVECAERVVVLLDSSKFGVTSLITVAPPDGIDVLVTDSGAPARDLEQLQARGVEVHVVGAGTGQQGGVALRRPDNGPRF